MTLHELRQLGRQLNTAVVTAAGEAELYEKLNTQHSPDQWTTLRAPVWVGDTLVVMVVRQRAE